MKSELADLTQWLQTTSIFQSLPVEQLISLTQIVQIQNYQKGEIVFQEGSEATGFFIVKIGRIKVFKISDNGKEQILNIFEPADNFAEVVALDGKCFPASAAALERAQLVFFPRQSFLALIHEYPDIAIKMLSGLSQHLRHLTLLIEELSFKDVPQRLASYLLNLSDVSPKTLRNRQNGKEILTLDLTKSQLAAALGTIPATLSRAFYRLSSEGIIAIDGPQIELLDRDRLKNFINLEQ
jgi:CRP/FNR family transcriptional regulator